MPATSAKEVLTLPPSSILALLFPKLIGPDLPPIPPCICLMKKMKTANMIKIGKLAIRSCFRTDCSSGFSPVTATLWSLSISLKSSCKNGGLTVSKDSPLTVFPLSV